MTKTIPKPIVPNQGFVYLAAVMDWYSRRVLSWRVSTTMDASFCIEALEQTIEQYGCPEIFNTDQGSQFTSEEFTQVLKKNDIRIGMDGKGRGVDNVFVERMWRSVKYEEVYLRAYDTVEEAKQSLGKYFDFYNTKRRHQSLGKQTPDSVYSLYCRQDGCITTGRLIQLSSLWGPLLLANTAECNANAFDYLQCLQRNPN